MKKYKLFLGLIFLTCYNILLSQSAWNNEAAKRRLNDRYEITKIDNNILKLKHKIYGKTKYVNISDRNVSIDKLSDDMQIFDLINTPDSIYSYRYRYKGTFPVSGHMGYSMVIGDFNNNRKVDFFGAYRIPINTEIAEMAIAELKEDTTFVINKIYTDSIVFAYAVSDLDKDGLIELNTGYAGTQWPEIHNYESRTDSTYPDTVNFAYREYEIAGQISSETFTDLDKDGITDVIHVGDDSLAPHGYKVYVAEYKKEVNNLVQVFRFPPPTFNVYGFSVGDFDNDGFNEFATGSIDGDVYVIENTGDDSYHWIFSDTLSTPNAYLTCATNDIDGNGKIEFFTGGSSYYNGIGGTKVYWFEADGDNSYQKVRTFFLMGTDVLGNSTLYNYDVNSDGKKDLVFAFENIVVMLTWNIMEAKFDIFYLDLIEDWQKSVQSVNIYDTYNNGRPDLYLSVSDLGETPYLKTYFYMNDFPTTISDKKGFEPVVFNLSQNFPNPFNSSTQIKLSIQTQSAIYLTIYDITGKEVIKLIENQIFNPGEHSIAWNGKNDFGKEVSSGIYLYQLKTKNLSQTRKLIFIK